VIGRASLNYPSILSKVSSREAAAADVKTAEWQRYPSPSIETITDRSGSNNFVLRVQQVLWAGGSVTNGIRSAKSLREASERAVREAQFDVASRVIDAYVDAVRQQDRLLISRKNLKQHELLDDAIKRRVASEVSPQVDQILSRTRLSQAVNDLSVINQALSRSQNSLAQLAGRSVTRVEPVDLQAMALPPDRDAALEQAVAASPTLSRLVFEEDAAEAQIKVKKAVFWPSLALRYEKGFNNNPSLYGSASDNRVMAVLEAQPGAGLSAFSGVASAVARKEAATQERRGVLLDLQRVISDAWSDMEAARNQLQVSATAQSSAEEVAESYKRQYIIGRKAWLDVLNSVREATQTELSVVDAKAQLSVATLRIALLTDKIKMGTK
jgi:outer membrane protein, adhesin transport system